MPSHRIEKDSMGEMKVPKDSLWGASTARACENFPVSGRPVSIYIIHAYAELKKSAALANAELGLIAKSKSKLIIRVCEEILSGHHDDQFPVDVFQTGSGTSTNMNLNEVIANRCSQLSGKHIGSKKPVHPNNDVNYGQSSNDTFPTAMQVALVKLMRNDLVPAMKSVRRDLASKERRWASIYKVGRTHLQDATPVSLGQEFGGYRAQVDKGIESIENAIGILSELPIGGTAVGTGINTHPRFSKIVCKNLSRDRGFRFFEAENHFEAQSTRDSIVDASGILRSLAVRLSKIVSDIRLMGMGPRCGLGELTLPGIQPGSSIMPGKTNPVICESVMQVCARVIGNDVAIATGGLGGVGSFLELNVSMPMIADAMVESTTLLSNAFRILLNNLLHGLEPNKDRCNSLIEDSLAMCTSLAPVIGYDKAASLAHRAWEEGRTIRSLVEEEQILDIRTLNRLLDPAQMTRPGVPSGE